MSNFSSTSTPTTPYSYPSTHHHRPSSSQLTALNSSTIHTTSSSVSSTKSFSTSISYNSLTHSNDLYKQILASITTTQWNDDNRLISSLTDTATLIVCNENGPWNAVSYYSYNLNDL